MSKHANSKSLEDDDHRLLLSPHKLETTNPNKSFSHASSRSRSQSTKPHKDKNKAILLIHGGAGTMARDTSTPDRIRAYKEVLEAALIAGYNVLQSGEGGGEAMDAAVAAVSVLEDCPLFNAGKGAVFNVDGKNELEASIMLSKPPSTPNHPSIPANRRGLGLTLLTHARNPSRCARALYLSPEFAPHTILSGEAAEKIAQRLGEEMVDPAYFYTEERWREHRRGLGLPEEPLPYSTGSEGSECSSKQTLVNLDQLPQGTVGAVALDSRGCIACATSTGGRTNKLVGRIGDTPQMSAGFWAEEWRVEGWWRRKWRRLRGLGVRRAMGVSGTGDGDYFIRYDTAGTLAHRMKFLHESVGKASSYVVEELRQNGGVGGVITLDSEVALCLNSTGMYRGAIGKDGIARTAIFDDEELA